MVDVVRLFFQCLTDECERILASLRERYNIKKVYRSAVVPNFFFIELEGDEKEVGKLLEEGGVDDFKVVRVVA